MDDRELVDTKYGNARKRKRKNRKNNTKMNSCRVSVFLPGQRASLTYWQISKNPAGLCPIGCRHHN
jgi:hypothetical protein